jgi:hypothetical protein
MSQSDSDPGTFSPGRLRAATTLFSILTTPQWPQEVVTAVSLLDLRDIRSDLKQDIDDAKADVETNVEERAFMGLPPSGDDVSVGAESQFSDATPQAPGEPVLNLQQKLTTLCALRDSLSSKILENGDKFFQELQTSVGIPVYGNHPIVAVLGKGMLVPMLSFYGVATKETIAAGIKPNIPAIRDRLHEMTQQLFTTPAHEMTRRPFTTPAGFIPVLFPDFAVDCTIPTAANMVWNVRLKLNGNIFTLLTFRVVAMTHIDFPPQQLTQASLASLASQEPLDLPLSLPNKYIHLCFALLSKACAKDFNCLCAMSDIDVELFKLIYIHPLQLEQFSSFFKIFLTALAEPQLDSKRSYMITALHNLVSNIVDPSQTGETLAYKKLFDGHVPGSGLNTFNPIMNQISRVIQILRLPELSEFELVLQVSLCGGRMIYKLGDVLRSYITQPVESNPVVIAALGEAAISLLAEMKKPLNLPSDSDYTLTFAGLSRLEPGFVQTILMFITLCTQLGIKRIVDDFCTSQNQDAAFFLRELVVIGMSLVGGDFQLSSARNSCDALSFLDEINVKGGVDGVDTFLKKFDQFARDPHRPTKSSLAPCDLVPKMNSGDYIRKIANYIFSSGYVDISPQGVVMTQIFPHINTIAEIISRLSMSTDQGFSSPIKVLFDILFTLFSIENFTNRAFVTQKINKELKRIAICASILFFHFCVC